MTAIGKALREQVRQRAEQRCEYCHKPEGISNFSHSIDHIIALLHDGSDDAINLAWACFQCNSAKSGNIASYDNGILTPLFNPRTQAWNDHFQMEGAVIVAKTSIGRVTIKILQMNHPDQLETRERLIRAGKWA
jgi:hypothetical protein